jgi:hypothetical protein
MHRDVSTRLSFCAKEGIMRRFPAVLAVLAILMAATSTQASLSTVSVQSGYYVELSAGSHQRVMNGETGGEFKMTVYNAAQQQIGSFYTFCADPTTYMNYGTRYYVKAVADSNALGYHLSDYGKWIYYEYAKNDNGAVVASYVPGHTTTVSNPLVAGGAVFTDQVAGAIQEGIWQELTKTVNGALVHDWPSGWNHDDYNAVAAAENWEANFASGNNADFQSQKGGIEIAQLTLNLGNVQNQMVFTMVSGADDVAPEPSTFVIWSLLGGVAITVGWWRRRHAT